MIASIVIGVIAALLAITAAKATRQRRMLQDELGALSDQLQIGATHDSLTGCLNRRGFLAALESEVARSNRYRLPMAIAVVNVDHLKHINDTFGHEFGDVAIRAVAYAIQTVCRASDQSGRIGGDEFAILLPETHIDGAAIQARRIRECLAGLPSRDGITVSIGIAGVDAGRVADGLRVLARADRALYQAKTAGRDCIRIDGRATVSLVAGRSAARSPRDAATRSGSH